MAQRSLCSQPARADQHRRARQTAAGLPCAAPGEQAAAAWPLCCAWCVVRVPPEAIQRAQPWTSRLTCGCTCTPEHRSADTLPEWSKGVDSSSTSASCVGSNPTGVNFVRAWQAAVLVGLLRPVLASAGPFPAHCMYPSTVVGRCCGAAELVFILSLCAESQGHFARVV